MRRNWRTFVLLVLLVGPIVAYVVFGMLWLKEHGWVLWAGLIWVVTYVIFTILADRWTRSARPMLPPLDWDAPRTFTPRDRGAWAIVEEEAIAAEGADLNRLSDFDVYAKTGQHLAERLAKHYFPESSDPVETVPVVELLAALELAAEDLGHLCREIPGGDLVTPGHFKQAVQAANAFNRANEIYTYLLPVLSPIAGLARLGATKLVSQPAWRSAQRSVLQWFYRAYVNRLGAHLIELYSGRLSIGADGYRRLTRRRRQGRGAWGVDLVPPRPVMMVAGAKGAGKSLLIASVEKALGGLDPAGLARIAPHLDDPAAAIARLKGLGYQELQAHPLATPGSSRRSDRARRDAATLAAETGDLLILIIDASKGSPSADLAFMTEWRAWFDEQPTLDPSPAIVVVTGLDRIAVDESASDGSNGHTTTVGAAARAWLADLDTRLPEPKPEVVALDLDAEAPAAVADAIIPRLAARSEEAERTALLRRFRRESSRSKVGRVLTQVGRQGGRLWSHLRTKKGG